MRGGAIRLEQIRNKSFVPASFRLVWSLLGDD
jgi:hypothetical protein